MLLVRGTLSDGSSFTLSANGLSQYTWSGPAFVATTTEGLVEVPAFNIAQASQTRNYFVGATMCGIAVLDTIVVTVLNSLVSVVFENERWKINDERLL